MAKKKLKPGEGLYYKTTQFSKRELREYLLEQTLSLLQGGLSGSSTMFFLFRDKIKLYYGRDDSTKKLGWYVTVFEKYQNNKNPRTFTVFYESIHNLMNDLYIVYEPACIEKSE